MAVFETAQFMLNDLESTTHGNMSEQGRMFRAYGAGPWQKRIADVFERCILDPDGANGRRLIVRRDRQLEVSELERARVDNLRLQMGATTPNEIRRRERLGIPLPGGEDARPGRSAVPRGDGMPGMGTPGQPKKDDTPDKAPGADAGTTEGA